MLEEGKLGTLYQAFQVSRRNQRRLNVFFERKTSELSVSPDLVVETDEPWVKVPIYQLKDETLLVEVVLDFTKLTYEIHKPDLLKNVKNSMPVTIKPSLL